MENNTYSNLKILFLLFKHKTFIIIFTAICAIASIVVSLMLPVWFTAKVNVVPPKDASGTSGLMGSVTSALKDFGLSKLGSKSGESYSFIVILESRTVVDSMISKFNLAETYDIPDTLMDDIRAEFLGNVDVTYEKEGNYLISITDKDKQRCAEMANYYVDLANTFAIKLSKTETTDNLNYLEKRLNATDSTLREIGTKLQVYAKSKQVISPLDQAQAVSMSLAEFKAQAIQYEIQYQFLRDNYGEDYSKTKLIKDLYLKSQEKLEELETKPGFAGNFALTDAAEVGINYLRLYAEFETFTKVKAFLMPMYEETRLELNKNQKNLYILDNAIAPQKKSKPKRSVIVVGATFGGFLLAILFVVLFNSYRDLMEKYRRSLEADAE